MTYDPSMAGGALLLELQGENVTFQMPALQYIKASVSNDKRLTPEHFPEVKRKAELEWEVGSREERGWNLSSRSLGWEDALLST